MNPDPYAYLNNVDLVKLYDDLPPSHLRDMVSIKLAVKQMSQQMSAPKSNVGEKE